MTADRSSREYKEAAAPLSLNLSFASNLDFTSINDNLAKLFCNTQYRGNTRSYSDTKWSLYVHAVMRKVTKGRLSSVLVATTTNVFLYQRVGGAEEYKIRSICLACLSHPPECVLSGGHVLCRRCVQDFGQLQNDRDIYLDACPPGHNSTTGQLLPELGPIFTGLSALVLDGRKTFCAIFVLVSLIVMQWWSPWDH